jgi:hypothetical protein
MAEKSTGFVRMEDGNDLPYVEQDGEKRILARLPTPKGHAVFSVPTWDEGVASGELPDIPFKDVKPFSRVRTDVPILDQDGRGACLPHAWSEAVMISRAVSGAPFVKLSPWFLYTLINGGRDAGSNAGDAYEALTSIGISPDADVPYATIRPRGYNQAAMTSAGRFKLRIAFQIKGFEQAVIAASLGYAVPFDLCAGAGFDVDSDGICRVLRGFNNHEVLAGEEYRIVKGRPYIGGRNSWGTRWGVEGRCLWQPAHLDGSQETYAVEAVAEDPQDGDLPPPLN